MARTAHAQSLSTTTVQGTVYLANGIPGAGTLQLSWPAFTTANNQAVTAGRVAVSIAADGFVSANLAANLGSTPAGLYYTAVYHMNDGTTSTEYWVVPEAAQASIAQVRAQVMPAAQAAQAVSKAYVDQAIQSINQNSMTSSGGTLTGPLYLNGDPTQSLQAADKHYVDAEFAEAVPMTGGNVTGPLTSVELGAAYQVDQFPGADFGAKLQACLGMVSAAYGGTCDARNFTGNLSMASNLAISTGNTTVMLPCATIATGSQVTVTAGTRNVALRGCALRGASSASGSQGGTVFLYSGSSAAVQVGDPTYVVDTMGFHLDNVVINTTAATSGTAQGLAAYRTQELDLESLYFLGNSNQTGMTLDGTGNYTGGTFYDNAFNGFQTAVNGIGHQVSNSAVTDWLNASTFVRLHVDCPTANGNPIAGTYGINLKQGDGNTFTGGDVEGCSTALHLGANAQNNILVGLRNENSTSQVVADSGSAYNNWITGGTMFTGQLTDNGTRNSFLDTFHRSFNGINGDWYGSQQDATLTNHFRLGTGSGNERGLLNRFQTDYGYRWTMGLSDAIAGEQYYQLLDELNNVYRVSIGQMNNGQSSTNNQTVLNAAGTGAVVLNGSNNSGTGGTVFGSGGPSASTVGTISNVGNAQFSGTLQVGGTAQSTGTMTVRNNADAEVDYYLWPGLTASQKGSFTYKDWNGNSQWYMVKDASNNWALNSAAGGLDSFKAYQSTNSGDTYINASNAAGAVRVNYETGSGTAFNIYGGNSGALYASLTGTTSIKFPGLAASSGHNCLQVDNSGFLTNTGSACGTGGGSGTIGSGTTGQVAYYTGVGTAIGGMSAVPISAGGTGATSPAGALTALSAASLASTNGQNFAGPIAAPTVNASVNSQINVMAAPFNAKGDCSTNDTAAVAAAQTAAEAYAVGNSLPACIVFPKPPGGCYIVSNLTYQGVCMEGQSSGVGTASPANASVMLRSLPGQDVLHVPDPTTTTGAIKVWPGWSIRNLGFIVDDSVTGSFPNRYPGRWFDGASMTAGSAVLSNAGNGDITCGDAGEPISVSGAGNSAGTTPLVTTIASVSPCWGPNNGWLNVTLAAPAQASVTNAHTYISVLNLPVTFTIGQCAIAIDMADGNPADWVASSYNVGAYPKLENVSFNHVGGSNTCYIYNQGGAALYGLDARNLGFFGSTFQVVQGTNVLNSVLQPGSGDYEIWDHLAMLFTDYPWISYNGLGQQINDVQITAEAGFQILQVGNNPGDYAEGWTFSGGMESPSSPTQWGFRVDGGSHTFNARLESGATGQYAWWDANDSICNCNMSYTYLNGFGNRVHSSNGVPITGTFFNQGFNNQVDWSYNANPFGGLPSNYKVAVTPTKEDVEPIGEFKVDAGLDGNASTPYSYKDLTIWPNDLEFSSTYGWANYVQIDSTSPSGGYIITPGGTYWSSFNQLIQTGAGGNFTLGTNLPLTGVTANVVAKCPSGTSSFTLSIQAATAGSYLNQAESCNTTYQTYTVNHAWVSGDSGKIFEFGSSSGTVDIASVQIVPWKSSINGKTIPGAGASIATGPATSTSGDCVKFADGVGTLADAGAACGSGGGGGLSGMTASQVPIAATASTVTSSKALAGTGTGIETGPTSGTNNYDLACFADTAGTLKDCSAANQVAMAYASGIAFNLNSTGGPAAIYLNGGSTSSTIGVVHEVSGTDYWRDALSGFGSGSDYVIRDDKAGKYILDFPSNIMPAQSIGGNANGPVLLVMQVPSARKGTFTCTSGGTITISNTNELATSDVIISLNTAGGTISTAPAMKTVTAGTGFSVLCGAADTSTYNYDILN
jgi:hypothetical protein